MVRKARSDSTDGIIAAHQEARQSIEKPAKPPAHIRLRAQDKPFWDSIVAARPASSWNASDLETAGQLARCKADIERNDRMLEVEGDMVRNDRGTLHANPRHSILDMLVRRQLALSRQLYVHAAATVGDTKTAANAAKGAKQAQDAQQSGAGEEGADLLAGAPGFKRVTQAAMKH